MRHTAAGTVDACLRAKEGRDDESMAGSGGGGGDGGGARPRGGPVAARQPVQRRPQVRRGSGGGRADGGGAGADGQAEGEQRRGEAVRRADGDRPFQGEPGAGSARLRQGDRAAEAAGSQGAVGAGSPVEGER